MNESYAKGKWTELKGELQKTWGKITGDEIEANKGDAKAIAGLVQQRYGLAKEEASKKVSDVFRRYGPEVSQKMENVKDKISDSVDSAKEKTKNALRP